MSYLIHNTRKLSRAELTSLVSLYILLVHLIGSLITRRICSMMNDTYSLMDINIYHYSLLRMQAHL